MPRKATRKPVRKSKLEPSSMQRMGQDAPLIQKTYVKGKDPRPYLTGHIPGLWSSNHLEEANQVKAWQFVAIRAKAIMCSNASIAIHRVTRPREALDRIEKKLRKANRLADQIRKAYVCERLEAQRERLYEKIKKQTVITHDSAKAIRELVSDTHPFAKLMTRWNPDWSFAKGIFAAVQQLSATGIARIWAIRNELNVPKEMYVLPTGLVMPRLATPQYPLGSYWLTPASVWGVQTSMWLPGAAGQAFMTGAEIDARDVKNISWPHPLNYMDGLSPMAACSMWVDMSNQMDRASWYGFENAERPGLIFKKDPTVNPGDEEMKQFREDLRAEAAGTPNTGKHLILPSGLDCSNEARTAVEMDYENSRPQVRDMNLATQGMTPASCGVAEAKDYGSFWASVKQTTEMTVQPTLNLIAQELSQFLGDQWGDNEELELTLNAPAIDDPQLLENRLGTDIQAGNVMTVREYRALRGMPPFGDERDDAFVGQKEAKQTGPIPLEEEIETLPEGTQFVSAEREEQHDRGNPANRAGNDKPDEKGPHTRTPMRDAAPGRMDLNGKSARLNGKLHKQAGGEQKLLEVPDIRQEFDYDCGAAAAMTVGSYFGVGPDKLSEWRDILHTDAKESTRPEAIMEYLASLGLSIDRGDGMSLDDLSECWQAGRPVIVAIKEYGMPSKQASFNYGHFVVVIGRSMGYVFVQDPALDNADEESGEDEAPGRMMIRDQDFLDVWHDQTADGESLYHFGIIVGVKVRNVVLNGAAR